MPETLREKASKKVQGLDANPSQLGDPISVKAEHSDNVPTDDEAGAASSPKPQSQSRSESNKSSGRGETLREKAAKKLNGPDANPSQLGDPISLKNETSPGVPVDSEKGAENQDEKVVRRDSKL
ncbi:hypothetical protein NPX13_g1677 [Xylaria arbuscula]|uniref:Uncharacterized protein n=1 Tax=Xylaria arbuscula TaxID=114810 RepID=A0A9W8NLI5_9PEZI|nr:hypothetical protein NPX13_g1677 [Xylaria arbuscula]